MDIENVLHQALAPFADPATEVRIVLVAGGVTFGFTRKGSDVTGSAREHNHALQIRRDGQGWQPLQTFLASEEMAHLDQLAQVQQRIHERAGLTGDWVAGPASVDEQPARPSTQAFRVAAKPTAGKTRIAVVDGPAGMGKTTLCMRVAAEQASTWLQRKATNLLLVVSSRGRRLSRLNDAIAATLQDLRVPIYYPEIPTLVRHGLITLVIDGFDELVNQDGYDDAWYSLSELLDAVSGGGVLVLSSRDTFFSEQEFVQRAQRSDPVWAGRLSFSFLRLLPWTRVEAGELLAHLGVSPEAREQVLRFFGHTTGSPLLRPFFVRQLAAALENDSEDIDPDHLVPVVVDSFLAREASLLFPDDEQGKEILRHFFWELSAEMKTQEREALELDVIQFYLDAVLEDHGLPDERRRQVVHKAASVAFLDDAGAGVRGRRQFPHRIVSDYFFAEHLLVVLAANRDNEIIRLLSLGVFGIDLAEVVGEAVAGRADVGITRAHVQTLFTFAHNRAPTDPAALNAVAFAFALLRSPAIRGSTALRAEGLHLGGVSLAGAVVPALTVEGCSFGFLDLTDAMAVDLTVRDTQLQRLRVSTTTRLGRNFDASPTALELYEAARRTAIYDPAVIIEKVDALRQPTENQGAGAMTPGEALLDELNRRWLRRFYLNPVDLDDEPAFGSPLWPPLRALLERHSRLEAAVKSTSGPRRELLHLKDPRSLLERRHADPEQQRQIDAIWAAARRLQ